MIRKTDGFTLVELLVTILCSSLVMLAAASLMLLGARVEAGTLDNTSDRQTVQIMLTMLEKLAGSGRITEVKTVTGGTGSDGSAGENDWILLRDDEGDHVPLVLYNAASGTLTSGAGVVLMDGLTAAKAEMSGNLLTFTLKTDTNTEYATSVYCRVNVENEQFDVKAFQDELTPGSDEEETAAVPSGRAEFLVAFLSQYGSRGEIIVNGEPNGDYASWYNASWSIAETAWCACYVSWAAAQVNENKLAWVPYFSYVKNGITEFVERSAWHDAESDYTPVPGDLIFFDWEEDGVPDHVGVVMLADGGVLYTIEGNSSGCVAVRSYSALDSRIVGYGVFPETDESGGGEE